MCRGAGHVLPFLSTVEAQDMANVLAMQFAFLALKHSINSAHA